MRSASAGSGRFTAGRSVGGGPAVTVGGGTPGSILVSGGFSVAPLEPELEPEPVDPPEPSEPGEEMPASSPYETAQPPGTGSTVRRAEPSVTCRPPPVVPVTSPWRPRAAAIAVTRASSAFGGSNRATGASEPRSEVAHREAETVRR